MGPVLRFEGPIKRAALDSQIQGPGRPSPEQGHMVLFWGPCLLSGPTTTTCPGGPHSKNDACDSNLICCFSPTFPHSLHSFRPNYIDKNTKIWQIVQDKVWSLWGKTPCFFKIIVSPKLLDPKVVFIGYQLLLSLLVLFKSGHRDSVATFFENLWPVISSLLRRKRIVKNKEVSVQRYFSFNLSMYLSTNNYLMIGSYWGFPVGLMVSHLYFWIWRDESGVWVQIEPIGSVFFVFQEGRYES